MKFGIVKVYMKDKNRNLKKKHLNNYVPSCKH